MSCPLDTPLSLLRTEPSPGIATSHEHLLGGLSTPSKLEKKSPQWPVKPVSPGVKQGQRVPILECLGRQLDPHDVKLSLGRNSDPWLMSLGADL